MADIVQSIKELPTWLILLVVVAVGLFVLIPLLIVLAAVIGAFVLNLGGTAGEISERPMVELEADHDGTSGDLTITHAGGDSLDREDIEIRVEGETYTWDGSGAITQGDRTTISGVSRGDTVRVVWTDSTGEQFVLREFSV